MSRITNAMLTNNYLSDMQTNLGNMSTLQQQLSSGKTIQNASQDTSAAAKIMRLNGELTANTQYSTNITDTSNWLDTTDTALGEAGNVLSRIRELMVKAGNGSYGADEISSIKDELVSNVQQLGQIMNTSFDGNYIFGGTKSTSKPVAVDSTTGSMTFIDANGNPASGQDITNIGSDLTVEISEGVKVNYNQNAVDLLQEPSSANYQTSSVTTAANTTNGAMGVFNQIIQDMTDLSSSTPSNSAGDIADLNGASLNNLDSVINNFLSARSKVGALENRMESVSTTNSNQKYNMTSVLSNTEDVDITEKTVEYSSAQTVYTAALQVSSSVLTKTIMDYI